MYLAAKLGPFSVQVVRVNVDFEPLPVMNYLVTQKGPLLNSDGIEKLRNGEVVEFCFIHEYYDEPHRIDWEYVKKRKWWISMCVFDEIFLHLLLHRKLKTKFSYNTNL